MGVKLPNLVNCSINYSLTCIKNTFATEVSGLSFLAADKLGGKQ